MGQILRGGRLGHRIRVPADMAEAIRFVLDLDYWIEDSGLAEDENNWARCQLAALRRVRRRKDVQGRWTTFIEDDLCEVRNLLDTETLMCGQSCEEACKEEDLPYDLLNDGFCYFCDHCKYLVLRDRIDYWLDHRGCYQSSYYKAYIGTSDDSIEDTWKTVWNGGIYHMLVERAEAA